MAKNTTENIHEELINTLLRVEKNFNKYNQRRLCNRNAIDLESLKDIPNPQNNTYKIHKLKMDVQNCSNINKRINLTTMPHRPEKLVKFVNNFNNISLGNINAQRHIVLQQSRMKLLRKYFTLWKIKWIQARNTKNMQKIQEQHQVKITNFLEALKKRKESIEEDDKIKPKIIRSASTKSKKFNACRKTCSAPSLSKMTQPNETTLNNIENDINQSIKETKSEIKALTLPKLKSCYIQIGQDTKKPKFLTKVPATILKSQELAKQREEKRNILSEKKQLLTEKMRRALEEAELMQKKMQLEYKKQKFQEYKDKKREEEEELNKAMKEKMRWIELYQKSKNHFHTKLKQKFFYKLKELHDNLNVKFYTAIEFHEISLIRKHFISWKLDVRKELNQIQSKADTHYQQKILRKYYQIWTQEHNNFITKNQVAQDFYEFKLMPRIFGLWHEVTCLQYIHWQDLKGTAIVHYKCTLKKRCFFNWKKYIIISKGEKEKDKRLQKWIRRVQEIIPNFEPARE